MSISQRIKSVTQSPIALLSFAVVLAVSIWLIGSRLLLTHSANVLRCYLTGIAPEVSIAQGPISIDQTWKEFELPVNTGIYRLASIEYFGVKVLQSTTRWDNNQDRELVPDNGSKILTNLADGQEYYFSVKAIDDQNREVMLHSGIFNAPKFKNPPYIEPGFSLVNWRWDKAFYAPDTVIKKIAVKSSHPVTVHEISWSPMSMCLWPDRTWRDIEEKHVYRFEEPSPVTDKLVPWEKYHPPGTQRVYYD